MCYGNWRLLAVVFLSLFLIIPGGAQAGAGAARDDWGSGAGQSTSTAEDARRREMGAEAERQRQETARREWEAEVEAERQRQAQDRQRRQEESQRRAQARQRAEEERVQRHNQQVLSNANARIQGLNTQAQALTGMIDNLANAWQAKMERDDERDQLRQEEQRREEEERRWQEEQVAIRAQEEEAEQKLLQEEEELRRQQEEEMRRNEPARPIFDLAEKDYTAPGSGDPKLAALMGAGSSVASDTAGFSHALFGASDERPLASAVARGTIQTIAENLFDPESNEVEIDLGEAARSGIEDKLTNFFHAGVRELIRRLPEGSRYDVKVYYDTFLASDTSQLTPFQARKNLEKYFYEMFSKHEVRVSDSSSND